MIQVKNVLVIDDQKDWRELIRNRLVKTFSRVDTADGVSFQDVIAQRHYELVVLDLLMPGQKSGREVFEWLKTSTREPRVIVVTALFDEEPGNRDLIWFQERDIPVFSKRDLRRVAETLRAGQCKEAADLDVLIVDDEEVWVGRYQRALVQAGVSADRIQVCSAFDEAAALIQARRFDVYILDVYLRTGEGLQPLGAELVNRVVSGATAAGSARRPTLVAIPVSTKDDKYLHSWAGPCEYLRSCDSVPYVHPLFFEKGSMKTLLDHITSSVPFLVQP